MVKHKGFTIVEVIIVIVVISILAAIAVVSYSSVRTDAMDAKIKTVVKSAGDAIQLHESRNGGKRIMAHGYFNNPNGVDALVPQYLPQDYRSGLKSKHATGENVIFRWYPCNDGGGGFAVYASLNNPTPDNIKHFKEVRDQCHHSTSQAPDTGSTQYNYAQTF